ncbi:glycosyl hydrolase [Ilyonectria destructans]|nr:glycosyl hydrolase [Ilyonectria destructans]
MLPTSTKPAFEPQWRLSPTYHLKAPWGWLNDPCTPGPYDKDGIFTGSLHPTSLKRQGDQLTVIYSSPALSSLRGEQQKTLYGIVSGGVLGKGPVVFLYAVAPYDLSKLEYIGPLIEFPFGVCRSRKWSGDFGANWECARFMTLRDGLDECNFLITGSEGGLKRKLIENEDNSSVGWCMWIAGTPREDGSGVRMDVDFCGPLDNGCFYAPNSCEHPIDKTRIVWGWLKEEDITLGLRESKGWTGCLSLPRELFYTSIPNATRALGTRLEDITSIKVDEELVVDRSSLNREGDIDKAKVQGRFTLFFQADENDVEAM